MKTIGVGLHVVHCPLCPLRIAHSTRPPGLWYPGIMDKILATMARVQLPVALLCIAFLGAETYLRATTGEGLGYPEWLAGLGAGAAGALGVKRPSEAAGE